MKQSDLWRTLRWALPFGSALASVVVGGLMGMELGIIALAGGVLAGVIAMLWRSIHGLTGETDLTLEEALSLAAPSAEEEEKRAVLRTLKDLEYEKSVGKISNEDYAELVAKYTARAKELIQTVDADMGDAKAQVERLLSTRIRQDEARAKESKQRKAKPKRAELETTPTKATKPAEFETVDSPPASAPESDAARASTPPPKVAANAGIECPECTIANAADARFCKSCGTPVGTT